MDAEKNNTLLIVDDEKMNIKLLSGILGQDYNIITASNGMDAIESAKNYKPDLILLDILMPGMDGYETLAEMKKCGDTQKIPVIIITGLDSDKDEEKGLALEASDYITKPFSALIVKLRVRNQIQIINQLRTIERLSMIDQLTNIPNRRSFDEKLQIEWRQAIREQTPISMLMMDIDHFKDLNDTYGHQQGDIVLQKIADVIMPAVKRPGDFAARWGGEEFVVLLPNTVLEGAMEVAEQIRKNIEKTVVHCANGSHLKLTISIGVNSLTPAVKSSIDAFISGADKALYAAKAAGRNKVVSND